MSPKRVVTGRRKPEPGTSPGGSRAADEKLVAYRRRRRRQVLATVLFGLAGLVLVSHLLEHVGVLRLMSPAAQDILVGYPTAGLLAIVGGIMLGVR